MFETATSQILAVATLEANKLNWPDAADQFWAVLNAPIPFALALVVVGAAIWKAMEWRYGGIIEMTRERVELAKADAAASKSRESELTTTVETLESKIEGLSQSVALDKEKLANEQKTELEEIRKLAELLSAQLASVSAANNAVSDSLSRIPTRVVSGVGTASGLGGARARGDAILSSGGNWPPPDLKTNPPKSTRESG